LSKSIARFFLLKNIITPLYSKRIHPKWEWLFC
jgi:hypothetical protein